ncbi:nudix hydrolase 1-like [Apium graveolens]|uniref:nudix hydrolase 1-like n=1 Tax=Apium graveolens TaxID=4045 RepID=UPI003D7BE29D
MEKVPGLQETLPAPFIGIAMFVIKGDKMLIGRRLSSISRNTFFVPGGHLEFGESFEQCAAREVKEETGLDVEKFEFLETEAMCENGTSVTNFFIHLRKLNCTNKPKSL